MTTRSGPLLLMMVVAAATTAQSPAPEGGPSDSTLQRSDPSTFPYTIPDQASWVDYGPALDPGPEGSWDFYLWGMLTASAVKQNGVYYLYYGGACCYDDELESVTDRALGVATSADGIHYRKHGSNPILTWTPNNHPEEGVGSGAALESPIGTTLLFYGANTEEGPSTINADGRLADSSDGIHFTDGGLVLDHHDGSVWGSGDELFPITAVQDDGRFVVYYLPNGTPQGHKLGVAWGAAPDQLDNTAAARSSGQLIDAWGIGGGATKVDTDTWALFINDISIPITEVRTFSVVDPTQLSAPLEIYQWPEVAQATVLLDPDIHTWFMYYRVTNQNRYGVKLAPAGDPDTSPPSTPGSVLANALNHHTVDVTWHPATDPESGILEYRVYRDDQRVGQTHFNYFRDADLQPQTTYHYSVSAVNYHGLEGPRSSPPVVVITLAEGEGFLFIDAFESGDTSNWSGIRFGG